MVIYTDNLCYRPRILVPDTNILVDNLDNIQELANSGDWAIRIPTTVVIELEGLSKSGDSVRYVKYFNDANMMITNHFL